MSRHTRRPKAKGVVLLLCLASLASAALADEGAAPGGQETVGHRDEAPIGLRILDPSPIAFHGIPADANPGQSTGMVYPAYGLVGFVAAIATHAALMKAHESHEQTRQEEAAEASLDPFRSDLANLSLRTLLDRPDSPPSSRPAYRILPDADAASASGWQVALSPTFLLSQDRRVLILEAKVSASPPPALEGASPYSNLLRVVSAPRQDTETGATASPEQAQHLIDDSAALLRQALEMLSHALREKEPQDHEGARQQRTVRYVQGDKQRFERGQVLVESCDRIELKTLRGWLMSVPRQEPSAPGGCPQP